MNAHERAGMARVLNQLGAEVTFSIPPHAPLSRNELAVARIDADVDEGDGGVTWPQGLTFTSPITVIMAPDADKRQLAMMRGVLPTDCTYIRTASPTRLMEVVKAADSRYWLFVGAVAVRQWRTDMQMRQLVNGVYPAKMNGVRKLAGVVESPGAVLRGSVDVKVWRQRISPFLEAVADVERDDAEKVTWRCCEWVHEREATCGAAAWLWDAAGAPWCKVHGEKGWARGVKQVAAVSEATNREMQGVML